MCGLPVSCPFNFPNGNLKQKLSHIEVFICYQNIDAKNKLNLHIYGIHLLNLYKTVVSQTKRANRKCQNLRMRIRFAVWSGIGVKIKVAFHCTGLAFYAVLFEFNVASVAFSCSVAN